MSRWLLITGGQGQRDQLRARVSSTRRGDTGRADGLGRGGGRRVARGDVEPDGRRVVGVRAGTRDVIPGADVPLDSLRLTTGVGPTGRLLAVDVGRPTLIPIPPRIPTAAMPRITRATRTSTNVSPWHPGLPTLGRPVASDLDLVEDAVHGGDQRDGDEADDKAHEDDDGRLEERGQLLIL